MTALAPRSAATRARRWDHDAPVAGLVDAAVDGDERAWAEICVRFEGQVRAVAQARLRDDHTVDDVVQETLVRGWTRLHQLEDPDRLGAWLKRIAANVAIDHVRRRRPTAPLEAARHVPLPTRGQDEVVVAAEESAVLHAHLDALRPVDRHALWHRDGHGVPVADLADELGMTAGSVRVLLSRARKRVRDAYGAAVLPLLGLGDRLRTRLAGIGESLPVAVAAPALVVVVVAGVASPSGATQPPRPVSPPPASAPGPAAPAAPTAIPADAAASPSTTASAAPAAQQSAPTRTAATESAPAPRTSAPVVELGEGSAGFRDEAPTSDDEDVQQETQVGPVDGLEVYLEESGITELEQGCPLC